MHHNTQNRIAGTKN